MIDAVRDTQALMAFLQSELQHLEAAVGAEDQEARQLLQQLEQQTAVLQNMSVQADQPVLTDLQLAEQLDNLDLQLSQLEASVAAADAPTLELLGQSTSRWMHTDQATAGTPSDTCRGAPAASASDCQLQTGNASSSGMNGCAGAGNSFVADAGGSPSSGSPEDPSTTSRDAAAKEQPSSQQQSAPDSSHTAQQASSTSKKVGGQPAEQQEAATTATVAVQDSAGLATRA